MQLFHAMGICQIEAGSYSEAVAWFERVQKESRKLKDQYWLGQYFINCGIAHYYAGDRAKAEASYKSAIRHAKAQGDPSLNSRALGNLAQVKLSEGEPDAAMDLIRESLSFKRGLKDRYSLAIAYVQMGTIEARRGNHRVALQHQQLAADTFAELDAPYDLAKTHFNMGNVYGALRQHRKARLSYRKAIRLAAKEGFPDLSLIATQGMAQACHMLREFDEIEEAFRELLGSRDAAKRGVIRISAHYGIGISQKCRGMAKESQGSLRRALALARRFSEPEWIFKCLVALASTSDDDTLHTPQPERLAWLAKEEEKRENWAVAAKLWELSLGSIKDPGALGQADEVFSSIGRCIENAGPTLDDQMSLFMKQYVWRRQAGLYPQAIETLERAEAFASENHLPAAQASLLDEHGSCCQRLNQGEEAVTLHKRSARLARRHGLKAQLRNSLNNLGEAFRKLGRTKDAVAAYEEAERLSRAAGDFEDALGIAANRGLALLGNGDLSGASAVLRRCAEQAKRRRCWREYVRALESQGNIAWHRNRLRIAEKRYKEALAVSRQQGIADLQVEIAVNYGSLLSELGSVKKALALLRPYEDRFGHDEQAHVCHDVMAELCMKVGDTASARKHWLLAKQSAAALGMVDFAAITSSKLAALLEEDGQFDQAEEELQAALEYEQEPEGCALLLTQLLRVQLAAGVEEKSDQTFEQAKRIAEEHGLSDVYIDIHIIAADYEWDKGDRQPRINALKGYLVAVAVSLSGREVENAAEAQIHLVMRLTSPNRAPAPDDYGSMLDEALGIFPEDVRSKKQFMSLVLWPFGVIQQVLPFVGHPRFSEELQRALRNHSR
jgi:tetratricopeptide (TPR) repeat protein